MDEFFPRPGPRAGENFLKSLYPMETMHNQTELLLVNKLLLCNILSELAVAQSQLHAMADSMDLESEWLTRLETATFACNTAHLRVQEILIN